jgi:hypothetical protein
VPEFGDHGGIIMMADSDDPTDYILFHDGELSPTGESVWKGCRFVNNGLFKVSNIRIAPKWNSKQFLMLGGQVDIESAHPTVISIDFQHYMPECNNDQYEDWSPVDETGHCIMGERTYYRRRKAGAKCFNGNEFESIVREEPCACTYSDYECAPCYTYSETLDRCVFTCFGVSSKIPIRPADACMKPEDKYFTNEHGYVLVKDNKCDLTLPGSLKTPMALVPCDYYRNNNPLPAPVPVPSPPSSDATPPHTQQGPPADSSTPSGNTSGMSPLLVVAIVVGVLLFLGAAGYAVYSRTNLVRGLFGKRPAESGPAYSPLNAFGNDDELGAEDETDA